MPLSKMRHSIIIFTVLWLQACQENTSAVKHDSIPKNSKTVTTKLIDSLGYVTYSLPNRYDTFFHWTNRSDCGKHCEKEQYRSQPKFLPISKESGFIYPYKPKDSVEQFTIIHSGWFPFREDTDTSDITKLHLHRKQYMVSSPDTYRIKFDTIENINGRNFSIIITDLYDTATGIFSKKVIGTTTIKSNGIEFKYELLSRRNDSINKNFIENSLQLLRTIKLNNGI